MSTKYIFITGGVVSSLGKGITAASIGRILKSRGLKVTMQKCDPYLNMDPGTMSPYQHGEVFVTEDGGETDLDIGHYERFVDVNLNKNSNVTTGKVYWTVISKERKGEFLGGTVQVIPHITNEIKSRIEIVSKESKTDVVITEIGGTVGDIESLPYLEAIRQMRSDIGRDRVLFIHVTLLPYMDMAGELKTKPTQHSVKELRSIGIQPDIIVCRSSEHIDNETKDKISLFCDIEKNAVIENYNAGSIYEVPLMLKEQNIDDIILEKLNIKAKEADLREWNEIVKTIKEPEKEVEIAVAGKYVQLKDAYLSIIQALDHGGIANKAKVKIRWVNTEEIGNEDDAKRMLEGVKGVLIPGGFGDRGIQGKINAAKHARENKIPFFGICLGMQCAAIEFARNVLGLEDANSSEFYPEGENSVIDLLPEQIEVKELGGTMRLGSYPCKVKENTKLMEAYNESHIFERHRHRYEFNNHYREKMQEKGLVFSGASPDDRLVEVIEIKDHPWFLGTQFHPELKSRPTKPHPLFRDFIKAALST